MAIIAAELEKKDEESWSPGQGAEPHSLKLSESRMCAAQWDL